MDAGGRAKHDSRDGGGRNASGTAFEDARADTCMDAGGTIPWMESVESSLEQRPRAKHDSRDGGGRNASGTAFEEARADACLDAGDTIPWMESVESSLEVRSLPLGT